MRSLEAKTLSSLRRSYFLLGTSARFTFRGAQGIMNDSFLTLRTLTQRSPSS